MTYRSTMRRRPLIAAIVLVLLVAGTALWAAPPAVAACAEDPDALALREMIDADTTGEPRFPLLILGRVVGHRDLGGDPRGGDTIARVEVVEHPVGYGPRVARVRFWKAPPGVGAGENLELTIGGRYGLVARQRDDGTFGFDGACGESRRLNHDRFRELVRYGRNH